MKLIIDIPEDVYRRLKAGDTNAGNTFHNTALETIGNGIPYEERPQGDLISRSALKRAFETVYPLATNEMGGVVNKQIYDIIDNAPTVEINTNLQKGGEE